MKHHIRIVNTFSAASHNYQILSQRDDTLQKFIKLHTFYPKLNLPNYHLSEPIHSTFQNYSTVNTFPALFVPKLSATDCSYTYGEEVPMHIFINEFQLISEQSESEPQMLKIGSDSDFVLSLSDFGLKLQGYDKVETKSSNIVIRSSEDRTIDRLQ